MSLKLTGSQMQQLVDALASAFDEPGLTMMLRFRLNKKLAFFGGDGFIHTVYKLVDASQMQGWTGALIEAARSSNPGNADLTAFEESIGLGSTGTADRGNLERIVRDRSRFVNPAKFRERLGQLEAWVCAIEHAGGLGTGVLVGADLVLTNYHVVEPLLKAEVAPQSLRCRFDFMALPGSDKVISGGRAVGLAAFWDVAQSPYSEFDLTDQPPYPTIGELDYAVIRLADSVGTQPLGSNPEPNAPKRGWLPLVSNPPAMAAGHDLLVLQHPQDLAVAAGPKLMPMQLAFGTVMPYAANGLRLRHDALTLSGSSGSPCFNADLDLVALHHAGDPKSSLTYKGEFNQAIPIVLIVQDLKSRQGLAPFWS